MIVITAVTHDRRGKIIKVRVDGVNREACEITDLVLSGAETAQADVGGTLFDVQAVDTPNAGRFLRGTGTSLDELPAAPLNLVTFGDSIAWGLGLKRASKYAALVAGRLSRANRGAPVMTQNFANSGAMIGRSSSGGSGFTVSLDTRGDNILGEVMDTSVTVHQQIDAFLAPGPQIHPAPETVDFILLNAGSNDIPLRSILSFLSRDAGIAARVRGVMTNRMDALLRRMLSTFPNARIYVTGYYPIVGRHSWPHNVAEAVLSIQYLTRTRPSVGTVLSDRARANIASNCKTFADEYELALNKILALINGQAPRCERLFFERPSFAPRHMLFGPPRNSKLWRLNGAGFVTDETARARGPLCDAAFAPASGLNIACRASSVGHPNLAGARSFFRAIRKHL